MMVYLVQQLLNGLMAGAVYALVAVGFTLVFGVLRVLNLAHPEVCMVSAFVGMVVMATLNVGFLPALIVAMAAAALLGIVIQRLVVQPTLKGGAHGPLLATLAASIILQNVVARFAGNEPHYFPSVWPGSALRLGPFVLPATQVVGFALALGLMAALTFYVWGTKGGKALRATAENAEAAECLGVNTRVVLGVAFAISSALGAAAGMMIGGIYGFASAYMGQRFGLFAMIAMIVGGLGSIPGAVVASLAVGLIETLAIAYGLGTIREGILFAVLILFLIMKPAGLFGQRVRME